ncbi:MAG: hypothetical protein WBX20_17670 [Terrimicrobiaceae bacterium]
MKVNGAVLADRESPRRLVGANRDIGQTHIGSLPFKLKPPSALDAAGMQTLITICTITILMTGCMLPPLPGFRVAGGQSRYYNDGPYYNNTPYYDNTPYYNNTPYYDDSPYYGNGPYANRRYYRNGGY